MFPTHDNPTIALPRHKFGAWLRAVEQKAGIVKLDGSLWHAYRRAWATSRKDLPAADVAAAGGWKDVATMIRCYQMPDDATLLEVMSHSKKIVERVREGDRQANSPPNSPHTFRNAKTPATEVIAGVRVNLVGAPGFEPGTSCSQSRRDTGLRYAPR